MTKLVAVMLGACVLAPAVRAAHVTLSDIDLASDTAWTLRCDEGPTRPIKVPGGGWNSDRQSPPIQVMKDVKDYVLYERKITIPPVQSEQAVKLCFGAVAHGCEVFLDGKKVGEHHGPQVPFEMDLTDFATAGKEQTLQVKAYHRRHYIMPGEKQTAEVAVGWDYPDGSDDATRQEAKEWHGLRGQSKVGYGIVRSIRLVVLPAVHVEDVFVRTSVSNKTFSCDVWLRNSTVKERNVKVGGGLSPWKKGGWNYPDVSTVKVTVPAKGVVKVTLGPVVWTLGPKSYWWPNIPFAEDYIAMLHYLNIKVSEGWKTWQVYPQRFGFVEHAEGPFYYTVNGVRVTGFSDATAEGQVSYYDSYSSPAFLPPTKPGTGAPESWRRYMRVGINMNRLHCSPPTETMMEAADEVGFMLIPEAPIWGNGLSRYNAKYTPQTYHDMGRACRNHPCIARYSLTNEVKPWPGQWPSAIDDMLEVDDVHPLTYELDGLRCGMVTGPKSGRHAWIMDHYSNYWQVVGKGKGIRGMGENFWATDGMGWFAVGARRMRINDWCYMSSWSWLNYWPNFLEGMNHKQHAWIMNNHADRTDDVDGWGSPLVRFVQKSLSPYLIQDKEMQAENPGAPHGHENGQAQWPYQAPYGVAGKPMEHHVEVFNGGLFGNRLSLAWSAHWDKPDGELAVRGGEIACAIEPGFHEEKTISFTIPAISQDQRKLYLVMDSVKDGKVVFHEGGVFLNVVRQLADPTAVFLGEDNKTQGDWPGKYGADGYVLIGREPNMPAYSTFEWKSGAEYIYNRATDDKKALAYFANPPTGKDRVAAHRYGNDVIFTFNTCQSTHRMTLYFRDYEKRNIKQEVEIADFITGKVLDKQVIENFTEGCYKSWKVQGYVKVTIRRTNETIASVSGVFLDSLKSGDH